MEGENMEQGKVIYTLLEKRVQLFSRLKDLLYQQQQALISGENDQVVALAEKQLNCMEEIQKIESQWKSLWEAIKQNEKFAHISIENAITLIFDGKELSNSLGYLNQLKSLAKEIDKVKRNNKLLIYNSISLIKNTLKHLQGKNLADAVYHPRRKMNGESAILNKKL